MSGKDESSQEMQAATIPASSRRLKRFLHRLVEGLAETDYVVLSGQPSGQAKRIPATDIDRLTEVATGWGKVENVYFSPLVEVPVDGVPGGPSPHHYLTALWLCVRHTPEGSAGQVSALHIVQVAGEMYRIPPSYIVEDAQGVYGLWVLAEPWELADEESRIRARALIRRLQDAVRNGAGPDGQYVEYADDLAWPLRVPETGEARILTKSARRYSLGAIEQALRTAESERTPKHLSVDENFAVSPERPLRNAQLFVETRWTHAGARTLHYWQESWWAWDGAAYRPIDEGEVRSRLYTWLDRAYYIDGPKPGAQPFNPDQTKINHILDALKAIGYLPSTLSVPAWIGVDEPPPYPHPAREYIACRNGLLHVPTGELLPHTPRFFAPFAVPFAYDPEAPPPERWLAFLRELWGDDAASIETLQEFMGYSLTQDTRLQKMLLIVGPLRGGKGTIGRVWRGLLGSDHVVGPTLSSLGTRFGLEPLIGKPLAIISDARLDFRVYQKEIVERLLSISGEDTLTIDRKFKPAWTGPLPTRIVMMTNELPRLSDASGALANRFIVLQLTKSWLGREDPHLTGRLMEELPGIFVWALQGLRRLIARGHFRQPESGEALARDLKELASPVMAFVEERCELGPSFQVAVDVLYQAWRDWCQDNGYQHPGSKQEFGKALRSALPAIQDARPWRTTDPRRPRIYRGIRLRPDAAPDDAPEAPDPDAGSLEAPTAVRGQSAQATRLGCSSDAGRPRSPRDPPIARETKRHESSSASRSRATSSSPGLRGRDRHDAPLQASTHADYAADHPTAGKAAPGQVSPGDDAPAPAPIPQRPPECPAALRSPAGNPSDHPRRRPGTCSPSPPHVSPQTAEDPDRPRLDGTMRLLGPEGSRPPDALLDPVPLPDGRCPNCHGRLRRWSASAGRWRCAWCAADAP